MRYIGLVTALLVTSVMLSHCGKYNFSSDTGGTASGNNPFSNGLGTPNPNDVSCNTDNFTQPQPTSTTPKVDILFVVHPTGSFQSVRDTVVNGLENFIMALPTNLDYTVAVLPAYTAQNPAAGAFYAPTGIGPVLTSSMGAANVQIALKDIMDTVPDFANYHDEDGMAALYTLLDSKHLPTAVNQGFFRKGASLAVVFLANEADICGLPGTDPGTDSDWATEIQEQITDCVDGSGNPINTATVFNQINSSLNLANVNLLTIGSVVYTSMTQQPVNGAEAEYGWGYIDITKLANGTSVDINGNIPAGLANIGQQVNTKLNLITEFEPTQPNLDPNTITVQVDGDNVPFSYHSSTNVVHIDASSAGKPGATVVINYCQLPPGAANPNPNACYGTLCQ